MNNTKKYFSLVENRIAELQEELASVQTRRLHSTQANTVRKCQLREDFLSNKISYLSKLKDLPMVVLLSNLSDEQIKQLQSEQKIPEGADASYLIRKLGLEKVATFVKQPKIVTMNHIKDAFINDFDSMDAFLSMNARNIEIINHRNKLYGSGLDGSLSYLQLSHDERKLNADAAKVDELVDQANEDFDLETLKEIAAISVNPKQKLSVEFILKHSQKVLAGNPGMEKAIKKLNRRKWFGWARKWLPQKANKLDRQFMEALNAYYTNHPIADNLDVSSVGLLESNEEQLKEFVDKIQARCRIRQNQIYARRISINNSRKEVLAQIADLEKEQKTLRTKFVSLMRDKTNFLPKTFQEQIWTERDLKESCMKEDCYLEEKRLIAELTRLLDHTEMAVVRQNRTATIDSPKVKQLVA